MAPVLFLIFNRPELTQQVFSVIRAAKPAYLFIAADGPRRPEEAPLCDAARQITEVIDWPCHVERRYLSTNLGCKEAVHSSISWFFSKVPSGIILEDDCLPDASFFSFCTTLLDRYFTEDKVMHIAGFNPVPSQQWRAEADYTFECFGSIWGWASWARAWKHYDLNMAGWPAFRDKHLAKRCCCHAEFKAKSALYDLVYTGSISTWDMQWSVSRLMREGLSIIPRRNLVSNLGGQVFTHVQNPSITGLPASSLPPPYRSPPALLPDKVYAKQAFRYYHPSFFDRARKRLVRLIR
jgi:hypothetical protein